MHFVDSQEITRKVWVYWVLDLFYRYFSILCFGFVSVCNYCTSRLHSKYSFLREIRNRLDSHNVEESFILSVFCGQICLENGT